MKKNDKMLLISLVVIVVILVALGIGIVLKNKQGNSKNPNQNETGSAEKMPELELKLDTEEENQKSVTINALATTQDEAGIEAITLPDNSMIRSYKTTYVVNKNGKYTFKAKGNNGQTSTATIEVKNIREASSTKPYMPEGFSYVTGEIENGYTIKDSYGNEFVWVPVEDGKMIRNRMLDEDYEESTNTASALVNSVAQNYGFYIAKYEASRYEANGQKVACSMKDKSPWTNVTYLEAAEAASKMASAFGYEGYQTAILNSYAWDTTTKWIDQSFENYSTNTSYGNYSGEIRATGTTDSDTKNNICDLAGNVREWTTEIFKAKTDTNTSTNTTKNKNATNEEILSENVYYRVIRGGGANLNRTASSFNGYKENMTDEYWGFRVILYQ